MGTRFLPATKAQPKETLPLVDKPLIQYGVEEALDSGVDNIIVVTGRGKAAIEDHFDRNAELEHELESRSKTGELALVRKISDLVRMTYTRQGEPLGLGHAVGVTKELVGEEPFAVVLADDVIKAEPPCLKQLLNIYDYFGAAVIAVMEVPREQISAYGVAAATPVEFGGSKDRLFRVDDLVEKPPVDEAPSNLAVIGRYVFPARDLRLHRQPRARPRRRAATNRRHPRAHQTGAGLRLPLRGQALRRGRQARFLEGDGRVSPSTATTWARRFASTCKGWSSSRRRSTRRPAVRSTRPHGAANHCFRSRPPA